MHKICNKYAAPHDYASYVKICKNMQKYANICKICQHDFYMQNMAPHFTDAPSPGESGLAKLTGRQRRKAPETSRSWGGARLSSNAQCAEI